MIDAAVLDPLGVAADEAARGALVKREGFEA